MTSGLCDTEHNNILIRRSNSVTYLIRRSNSVTYLIRRSNSVTYLIRRSNSVTYLIRRSNSVTYLIRRSNSVTYLIRRSNSVTYLIRRSNSVTYLTRRSNSVTYLIRRSNSVTYPVAYNCWPTFIPFMNANFAVTVIFSSSISWSNSLSILLNPRNPAVSWIGIVASALIIDAWGDGSTDSMQHCKNLNTKWANSERTRTCIKYTPPVSNTRPCPFLFQLFKSPPSKKK